MTLASGAQDPDVPSIDHLAARANDRSVAVTRQRLLPIGSSAAALQARRERASPSVRWSPSTRRTGRLRLSRSPPPKDAARMR
jgi:hypothetical protein